MLTSQNVEWALNVIDLSDYSLKDSVVVTEEKKKDAKTDLQRLFAGRGNSQDEHMPGNGLQQSVFGVTAKGNNAIQGC